MSQIDGTIPIADGVDIEGVRRSVAADLQQMAKTHVTSSESIVRFTVGKGRWWRSGLPMDLVDSGEIRFNHDRRELVFVLSMRRTDIGCLVMSLLVGAGVVIILRGSIWFGVVASVMSFFWLWVGNHLMIEQKVRRYFSRLVSAPA
jgi:hypothetical protein